MLLLGALGVRARRADLFEERRLLDLGVRARREDLLVERLEERRFEDLGARALRRARRFPLRELLFLDEASLLEVTLLLGALGVRARRADFLVEREAERRLLDLGVRARREDLLVERRFEDLGARALRRARRLLLRERLFLVEASLSEVTLLFGALGVRARRADLRLEERRARLAFFAFLGALSERALFFFTPISLLRAASIFSLYAAFSAW